MRTGAEAPMSARSLLAVMMVACVLAVCLAGCKGRTVCQSSDVCGQAESCVYVHADTSLRCAMICQADGDCPEKQRCLPGAATCQTCQDMLRICK